MSPSIIVLSILGATCALALIVVLVVRLVFRSQENKWELVQENVSMTSVGFNPIWGEMSRGTVYVDVYRKKMRNGLYKYKNVKRH
jgi:hypothetical protein